jgi:hypothetical protein
MRLRNFHKRIKKANAITNLDVLEAGSLALTGAMTGASATLTGAVQGATVVGTTSVSGATVAGNLGRVNTQLIIPTTAYTGANATYSSIYATGAYLYWSNGAAWKSGAGGLG